MGQSADERRDKFTYECENRRRYKTGAKGDQGTRQMKEKTGACGESERASRLIMYGRGGTGTIWK